MPADRADDSYRIYSSLLPLGETAGNNWPHDLLLVQDATISVVPADQPCVPPPNAGHSLPGMNPHLDVHPPQDQLQDYLEILRDFDLHCHDSIKLETDHWNVRTPLRLLSPDEQKEFQSTKWREPKDNPAGAKYKGAAAIYAFSEVYFCAAHRGPGLRHALVRWTMRGGLLAGLRARRREVETAPLGRDSLDFLTH